MASQLSSKLLNPHAQSWLPDTNKSAEEVTQTHKLPFHLPRQIYGNVSSPVAVYECFPQPSPLHLHPAVCVFVVSYEEPLYYTVIQHQCLPLGWPIDPSLEFYTDKPAYVDFLTQKQGVEVKAVMIEELVDDSSPLRPGLDISGRPKSFRKGMPPRLGKYFEESGGRKRWVRKVWTPKNSEDGVAAAEIVPVTSLGKTTVMLKNIPNQYTRDSFMEFLDQKCRELHLEYDFLYLPMDFTWGANLGFAFVNFTTASAAKKIKSALNGFEWGQFCMPNGIFASKKILRIAWAKIQGKAALVRHFEHSCFPCDNIHYLPVEISPPSSGSYSLSSLRPVGQLRSLGTSTGHLGKTEVGMSN